MHAEHEPNGPSGFKPIPTGKRIESIDVVRGFALLGILVVNSLFFSLPLAEGLAALAHGGQQRCAQVGNPRSSDFTKKR